jgi:hypothetical protein
MPIWTSVRRLTVRPAAVFTRDIEHMFEYGLLSMMLEVLLWRQRWTWNCIEKSVLNR